MPCNALYTALSSAKSASGLFVVGNLKLTNIYVHNIRSLNKHWDDLTAGASEGGARAPLKNLGAPPPMCPPHLSIPSPVPPSPVQIDKLPDRAP